GIVLALFGAFFWSANGQHLYLCLVPLLWMAWRHGLARAVLAVLLINLGIVLALHAQGAAVVGSVQVFMGALALVGLVLGAAVSERRRAEAVLNKAQDVLEADLEKRVLELEAVRQDLEAQQAERRQIEEALQRSVDALQAGHDDLEAAMQQQAALNDKLRASELQLKDLNARKDKLFSIISHDVKSMLVSAIGFSKLLISDVDTLPREMIREFASHVHSSTTNTYDLLENLLTWTRMQTGRMYYQRAWHGVSELIENNLTMLRDNAARKGILLKKETNSDAQVYADRNMINSVLQNLISNAIKFTERGGEVLVTSETYDHTVEIAVTDTGIGIDPEDQEKLFRIDIHHSSRGTEDEDGTGLGLVLCKEMVEKHEGMIWVESEVGKGSSFHFTLPCAEAAPAPSTQVH
ncbi:MAG: ATP-binding protein, partial [Rhodothermales bacterium]